LRSPTVGKKISLATETKVHKVHALGATFIFLFQSVKSQIFAADFFNGVITQTLFDGNKNVLRSNVTKKMRTKEMGPYDHYKLVQNGASGLYKMTQNQMDNW